MLRRMYGELIESSKTYLKGKNRNHKKLIYRRRYDIVDDMIKVLEKDYAVLNDQRLDRKYSLNELLTSARSETISVDTDKVLKYHGSMSTRNMFTMEINGEQKKLAFTKREKLLTAGQLENRYKEFKETTDKYKTFPQLAWIVDKLDRDYFIMLGSTITEDEKKAMWARVEYLRLAIQNADTEGKQGNQIRIVTSHPK